jgi:hypothetical protein
LASYRPYAQSAQGDREFELSGNASSGNEFNTNNFGASASLSYYFTGSQEIGLRHGINVASLCVSDLPKAHSIRCEPESLVR